MRRISRLVVTLPLDTVRLPRPSNASGTLLRSLPPYNTLAPSSQSQGEEKAIRANLHKSDIIAILISRSLFCAGCPLKSSTTTLHIIQQEPERLEALWSVTNYALKRFREEGFEIGDTESPIIPLYVRDTDKTFMAVAKAFNEGVFINPVIPPACAPQDTLVRYALMATHTREQVDESVEKLKKVFKELEIL